MQFPICFYVDFPPSINNYYSFNRHGIFIKAAGRRYRERCAADVREQNCKVQVSDSLHVTLVLHAPDRRRRDLDNYQKCLLDALTHAGVWEDDSQLEQMAVFRGHPVSGGKVAIILQQAGPPIPYGMYDMLM